jgi:hypothetical protein
MVVTVFRSRLYPGTQDECGPLARRMSELVRDIPRLHLPQGIGG